MDREDHAFDFAAAPPRSAPGVASMVGYRTAADSPIPHRGLPSSRLTFIVSLDDGVEAAATAEALPQAAPAPLILGGLHTRASYVTQRRGQSGIQLAVHPLAARALFGVPAAELPLTDFNGTPVLGRWSARLPQAAADAGDWPQRFALIAGALTDRWNDAGHAGDQVRPELAYAWHLLDRSRGRIPITALADAVGFTPRHLGTLFHRETGRSPKQIAGLIRFERASSLIAAQVNARGDTDLAGVAAATGFSDQAHLTREFTRYCGTGPRQWITEELRNIQDGGHGARAVLNHD